MRKILLINPPNFSYLGGIKAYNGLGYLSAVLTQKGFEVLIADYIGNPNIPKMETIIEEFEPDVVGISSFTDVWFSIKSIIENRLSKYDIPIILGGPHAAISTDLLKEYNKVDAIVIGEAENIIETVVNEAEKTKTPKIYRASPVEVNTIPFPDFESFYGSHEFTSYSLISSRGCPYDCSFCCSKLTSSRNWRPRSIESCKEEVKEATNRYPTIEELWVMDDNFNLNKERGKELLEALLNLNLKQKITLANIRADKIDKELIHICKKLSIEAITVAVEHANPEVFNNIEKKETLEEIEKALELCKEEGIFTNILMLVGLPYDTYERTKESIAFVKKHKPMANAWSMMNPYPKTRAREWFDKHGKVYEKDMLMYREDDLYSEPICESPDFTLEERAKAYVKARLETASYDIRHPLTLLKAYKYIIKYNLYFSFLIGLIFGFNIRLRKILYRKFKPIYSLLYEKK